VETINQLKAITISLLLIITILSPILLEQQLAGGATVSATFGNNKIGNITNRFSTNKDASRFLLPESGTLQSITIYFDNGGSFSAKAAIYSDSNGAPKNLISQSSSKNIQRSGWVTFSVPQCLLSSGYYWLTVVDSSSRAQGRKTASNTASQHAIKSASYSNEYTSSFGSVNKYDNYATSIYATYTPSPTTTPAPTPTPAPYPKLGMYWDQACSNISSAITWGQVSPGTTKTLVLYARNEGNVPIALQKTTFNWNPSTASNYLTIEWDYSNQTLSPGIIQKLSLILTVSPSIIGIANFRFNTTITGTT
jgi:hypothetical protein